MCKIYGYMRVSTSEKSAKQDYQRQVYLFKNSGVQFDAIFEEHITGGKRGDQREKFNKMLELLQPTDIVYFTETSRFGRNYIDCFDMLDLITQEAGATVRFLSNMFELKGNGKLNPYEWLTISNFFIMDEFQKRLIGYNTKNALAAKKADGVVLGRPRLIDNDTRNMVISMHNGGKRGYKIAEELGISPAMVSNILKQLKENKTK